jgi:uncharacterized membrane protein
MPIDPSVQPGETPDPIPPSSLPPSSLPPAGTPPLGASEPVPLTPATDFTAGLTPNVSAGLSTVMPPFTGIVFLLLERRDQFVRFTAMQSVFFGVFCFVIWMVCMVIGVVLSHVPLINILWWLTHFLISLVMLMIWIVLMVKAFSGKEWELPFLGKMARQQLARTPNIGL